MKMHTDTNKSKAELLSIIANQAKQIQLLEEYILAHKQRQFALKSEKMTSLQVSFFCASETE